MHVMSAMSALCDTPSRSGNHDIRALPGGLGPGQPQIAITQFSRPLTRHHLASGPEEDPPQRPQKPQSRRRSPKTGGGPRTGTGGESPRRIEPAAGPWLSVSPSACSAASAMGLLPGTSAGSVAAMAEESPIFTQDLERRGVSSARGPVRSWLSSRRDGPPIGPRPVGTDPGWPRDGRGPAGPIGEMGRSLGSRPGQVGSGPGRRGRVERVGAKRASRTPPPGSGHHW